MSAAPVKHVVSCGCCWSDYIPADNATSKQPKKETEHKTLLLVNAGTSYEWAELIRTDEETYSIPLYICEVVHGRHAGETIGAVAYYNKVHY